MLNTLTGNIIGEDSGPGFVTLEINGVGYCVFVVGRTEVPRSEAPGSVVRAPRKFYIHENIVAAQQGPSKYDLYGFETQEERRLFRALISECEGVGPSTAMKAMNISPPEQLLQAIRLGNEKYLERGVGTRTAARIILGLGKYAAAEAVTKTKELV